MPAFLSQAQRSKFLALLVASAFVAPALGKLPSNYHLTDLGPAISPKHINKDGVVSGDGGSTAVLWTNGQTDFLDAIPDQVYGYATWVNASRMASGLVYDRYYGETAVVWSSTGQVTNLREVLPGAHNAPAINDLGHCVILGEQAYLSMGCTGTHLEQLDGGYKRVISVAGINSNNEVAGTAEFKGGGLNGARAFLYTGGKMLRLDVLPHYRWCYGHGLNARGHVVGECGGNEGRAAAFFYDGTTVSLIPNLYSTDHWSANAINFNDVVVGQTSDSFGYKRPFIIDMRAKTPKMLDLTAMVDSSGAGWSLETPIGINTAGQILIKGHVQGNPNVQSAILTPMD